MIIKYMLGFIDIDVKNPKLKQIQSKNYTDDNYIQEQIIPGV